MSKEDVAEDGWLLHQDAEVGILTQATSTKTESTRWRVPASVRARLGSLYLFALHAALLLSVVTNILSWRQSRALGQYRFNPGSNPIRQYCSSEFALDHSSASPYAGDPTAENEAAWEDLVLPSFIGLSDSEMRESDQKFETSVEVAEEEGGGYLATLEVYHELHCIRQLRMFLHQDYFYPDGFSSGNIRYLHGHLGHCLETLRMASMCRADTSVRTFFWGEGYEGRGLKTLPKMNASRTCVEWDPLHGAMQARAIPFNPTLVLPNGSHEKTFL